MEEQPQNYSQYIALKARRIGEWVKPDPKDNVILSIIKTILKSIAVLLLLVISPVLLIGFAVAFIGLL